MPGLPNSLDVNDGRKIHRYLQHLQREPLFGISIGQWLGIAQELLSKAHEGNLDSERRERREMAFVRFVLSGFHCEQGQSTINIHRDSLQDMNLLCTGEDLDYFDLRPHHLAQIRRDYDSLGGVSKVLPFNKRVDWFVLSNPTKRIQRTAHFEVNIYKEIRAVFPDEHFHVSF